MFLFDVKHINPEAHRRLTGQTNERILQNLRRLSDAGARIEIRMPLVPGCNDDSATLHGIGQFLGALRIEKMRVLPYHSMARSKSRPRHARHHAGRSLPRRRANRRGRAEILRGYGVEAVSGRA